jgi:hypothetical protein
MKMNFFYRGLNLIINNQTEIINLLKQSHTLSTNAQKHKDDQWVKAARICEFLNISESTLQKYRENKCITYSKYEGKTLYNISSVKRRLKQNCIKSTM